MPKYRAFPPETWAKLRELWQSGRFRTIAELHSYIQQSKIECPCTSSIRDRMCKDGGWDRKTAIEAAEQAATDRAIAYLAKQGLSVEGVLDEIVAAIRRFRMHLAALESKRDSTSDADARLLIMDQIDDVAKGLGMWLEQYKSFTGTAAPIKKIIPIDMESKWMVAQEAAANEAYEARLKEIEEEKAAANQARDEGEHAAEE